MDLAMTAVMEALVVAPSVGRIYIPSLLSQASGRPCTLFTCMPDRGSQEINAKQLEEQELKAKLSEEQQVVLSLKSSAH